MKRLLPLLLALPLVILAGGILRNEAMLSGATEWRIPIAGYDPRDMLRGHYIRFTYGWDADPPRDLEGEVQGCLTAMPPDGGPFILQPLGTACDHPVHDVSFTRTGRGTVFPSRIFVDEATANDLDALLRQPDAEMVVVAKLTSAGRLVNQNIEPARPQETRR